jgi:hypothetical protein
MGGQACVFYGAAEFSRDLDLLVPAGAGNLAQLESALAGLQARPIAVRRSRPITSAADTRSTFAAGARMWPDCEST